MLSLNTSLPVSTLKVYDKRVWLRMECIVEPAVMEFRKAHQELLELRKADGNGWVDQDEVSDRLDEVLMKTDHGACTWKVEDSKDCIGLSLEDSKNLAHDAHVDIRKWLRKEFESMDPDDEWTNFEIVHFMAIFLQFLYEEHEYRAEPLSSDTNADLIYEKKSDALYLDEDLISYQFYRMDINSNIKVSKEKCSNPECEECERQAKEEDKKKMDAVE